MLNLPSGTLTFSHRGSASSTTESRSTESILVLRPFRILYPIITARRLAVWAITGDGSRIKERSISREERWHRKSNETLSFTTARSEISGGYTNDPLMAWRRSESATPSNTLCHSYQHLNFSLTEHAKFLFEVLGRQLLKWMEATFDLDQPGRGMYLYHLLHSISTTVTDEDILFT